MKKLMETAVILLGTIGWWGFVYPELCLTQDVYEQAYEGGEETAAEESAEKNTSKSASEKSAAAEGKTPESRGTGSLPGAGETIQPRDGRQNGWQIGKICIKSRFAEYVYQVKEKETAEKELWYDK